MKIKNYIARAGKGSWILFFIGFVAIVLTGCAAAIIIKIGNGNYTASFKTGVPKPDDISVMAAPGGDTVVQNKTGGYYVAIPANWYVEKNEGAGLTVYPDYHPTSSVQATCKIEVSALGIASSTDLNGWLTDYFHADPTADVLETSLSQTQVGSSAGLEWRGMMNGATTTLVYALSSGNVFEIAPSTLRAGNSVDNDDCDPALREFLSGFTFGAYHQ